MKSTFLIVLLFFFYQEVVGQNPFLSEVTTIQEKYQPQHLSNQEHIVFTGSSSIRFWNNLPAVFNEPTIINTGFGGSQTSDLLEFHQELILDFNPKKVFIYEGDNDIAFGKKPTAILRVLKKLIRKIKSNNLETEVIIIAAKPSISRWQLKEAYIKLNKKFKKLAQRRKQLEFADVWNPMLKNNQLQPELFIEDGLHMNAKGYRIWKTALTPFLR